MFARLLAVSACAFLSTQAFAQAPITVMAEGVATVSVKPDHAKIYLNVETKAGEAAASAEANHAAKKELIAAIEKLGLKGTTWASLPQKITKDRPNNAAFGVVAVGPGGAPPQAPPESYSTTQMVIYSANDADAYKLGEMVEKITQAAAAQGITGDKAQADSGAFNPFMGSTKNGARVVYSSKSGWDSPFSKGLAVATEKAMANAAAIARGAGLRVDAVVEIEELPDTNPAALAASNSPYASLFGLSGANDEYAEGELTRKVRVRVKVTATK